MSELEKYSIDLGFAFSVYAGTLLKTEKPVLLKAKNKTAKPGEFVWISRKVLDASGLPPVAEWGIKKWYSLETLHNLEAIASLLTNGACVKKKDVPLAVSLNEVRTRRCVLGYFQRGAVLGIFITMEDYSKYFTPEPPD